jgi:glycosyltransferase involved in cell wall biosynthesis
LVNIYREKRHKLLTVVIPVYNEEAAILHTIDEMFSALKKNRYVFEVVVVNDGSTDGTFELLRQLSSTARSGKKNASLHVIHHPHNMGYGAAIKTGLKHAKYEYCAIIDADLTYAPDEMVNLFQILRNRNFDMVVGMRTGRFYKGSPGKQVLRFLLRKIVEYMSGRSIPDINSGARVFKKSIAMKNSRILSDKFSFTTSLTLAFMMRHCFVHYEPIHYFGRKGNTKVKIFKDSIRTLGFILSVSAFFNPLRVFFPLFVITGLSGILIILCGFSFSNSVAIGLGMISLLVGVVVFSLGVLTHVVGFKLGDEITY